MRSIQVLISSLLPFLIGIFAVFFMLFEAGGVNSFPFELVIIVIFYIFPAYCLFCLPFYFVVHHLKKQLKRISFCITVLVLVYLQGFIVSFMLNVPLFSEEMLSGVFPLFSIMMLSFVCCLFVFTKRVK